MIRAHRPSGPRSTINVVVANVPPGGKVRYCGATKEGAVIEVAGKAYLFDAQTGAQLQAHESKNKSKSSIESIATAAGTKLSIGQDTYAISARAKGGLDLRLSSLLIRRIEKSAVFYKAGECIVFEDDEVGSAGVTKRCLFLLRKNGFLAKLSGWPSWLVGSDVVSDPVLGALVFARAGAVAWIPFGEIERLPLGTTTRIEMHALAALHNADEVKARVTFLRAPGSAGISPVGSIGVKTGEWSAAVIAEAYVAKLKVGDELVARKTNQGECVLFDARGDKEIARGFNLYQLFRGDRAREASVSDETVDLTPLSLPKVLAEANRRPATSKTLSALRSLGIAATLDGEDLDDFTNYVFARFGMNPQSSSDRAAYLLEKYFTSMPASPSAKEVLVNKNAASWTSILRDAKTATITTSGGRVHVKTPKLKETYVAPANSAVEQSAIANEVLASLGDSRRYYGVMNPDHAPFFLLLNKEQEGAITKAKLLRFEKVVQTPLKEADGAKDISKLLAEVLDLPASEFTITQPTKKGAGIRITLSLRSASALTDVVTRLEEEEED